MKPIIQFLLLLLLMFLFIACKTSSRLSSTAETNRKADVQLTQHATSATSKVDFLSTHKDVALDITEEITVFDTSKPNVAGTDHPPALKTTVRHIKSVDNSTINKQSYSNNQATSNSQLKMKTKESAKEKVTETHESKAMFTLPLWIYPAAIVLILAALYFFCPPIHVIINKLFHLVIGK